MVSSACIRSTYDQCSPARAVTGRCHRRQLRPDRTQIYRRQTCRVQAGRDAAACNDALGCASRFINACTRRHGAFRRGVAVPRAQVELVAVRRTCLLPLVPGQARWKVMHLATNQGESTRMPIVPIEGTRGRGRRRQPVPE